MTDARSPYSDEQRDRLDAATELIGRTGARNIQFGYLHDDVPVCDAAWYATASYEGTRIICENKSHPIEAIEGLATRLLTGAQCQKCKRLITLNPMGAYAADSRLLDGTKWSAEEQAAAGLCLWVRIGRQWVGCDDERNERRDDDSVDSMVQKLAEFVSEYMEKTSANRGKKTKARRGNTRRVKRKKRNR